MCDPMDAGLTVNYNKFQCYVTITSVFNKVVRWHRLGEVKMYM